MKTKRLQRWWEASCKGLLSGLIPLLALSGNLQAQECVTMSTTSGDTPKTPIPMFVEGHEWKVLRTTAEYYPVNRRHVHFHSVTLKLGKEEEIEGKKYYAVYEDYTIPGKEVQEPKLFYYAREEGDKIYFRPKDKGAEEKLAFDYGIAIGDILGFYNGVFFRPRVPMYQSESQIKPDAYYRLAKVDTLFIAGKMRRYYHLERSAEPNRFESPLLKSKEITFENSSSDKPNGFPPFPWGVESFEDEPFFYWIEGIGGNVNTLFIYVILRGGNPGDKTLCFRDEDGVEHDLIGKGCLVNFYDPPKPEKREVIAAEIPAKVSLKDGKLVVESADGGQHKVALFALDGTPLLQETSFTGTFETQLTHHESAQPMLLLFDGKASIQLYNSPK